MMEEKAKRKEKPKNKAKRGRGFWPFIAIGLILVLVFLSGAGIIRYTSDMATQNADATAQGAFEITRDFIIHYNETSSVYLTGTYTATIRNATATAEAEQRP